MITRRVAEIELGEHERDEEPDWDRTEWVGDGQDDGHAEAAASLSPSETRWNKWQWIGEGQGEAGPNRGRPAAEMPDGESELSGHNHAPSAEHWGGSGWRQGAVGSAGRSLAAETLEAMPAGSIVEVEIRETVIRRDLS